MKNINNFNVPTLSNGNLSTTGQLDLRGRITHHRASTRNFELFF